LRSSTGGPSRKSAAGQFTDRKVAFEEIADDRIAREVAKELGYKVP
jgi:hypothetical protein